MTLDYPQKGCIEGLNAAFLRVIERHTAGSPMDDSIKWTHLTRQQIADRLADEEAISISVTVVDQVLDNHQFRRRQALKRKATGSNPARNAQFEKIHELVERYQSTGEPVIRVCQPVCVKRGIVTWGTCLQTQ